MKVLTYSFITLLLLFCSVTVRAEDPKTKDQPPLFSLEEKVGQLFLIGFKGTAFDSGLKERIDKINPGGLIFFKRNIPNTASARNMIYGIQKYLHSHKQIPIFTAIDQEGGAVTRIRTNPPLPSALAMGRVRNPKVVNSIGVATGKKLKYIGFNLNLAPVLDLSDPNKFSFIGNRSFGNDPETAATAAIQFSRGVESAGVLSTAKHFPGHGNVGTDSHVELPVSPMSKAELMATSVFPYKKSIESDAISAVMMAHMLYPNIDESYPATYSKKIIDILKVELGFKGIILTDDIQMTGANIYPSIGERAVQAFIAGNDMIMVAWSYPDQLEAYNGILEAVRSGRIAESRVDESFKKIYDLKKRFTFLDAPVPPASATTHLVEKKDPVLTEDIEAIFKDILTQEQKKMASFDFKNASAHPFVVFSSEESFLNEFKKTRVSQKTILVRLKKTTSFKNIELFQKRGRSFIGVVHVSGPVTAKIINRMPDSIRKNFILVNNYFPGAIRDHELFHATIDIPLRSSSMGKTIANWLVTLSRTPASTEASDRL